MKVQIPNELKTDVPPTPWGKTLSATPVVMAVIATLLAGLASSEMTRAQYDRSLAAQRQSKAGDQWSFFQAKKLRGALQQNTLDMVESTAEVRPLNPAALRPYVQQLPDDAGPLKAEVLALLDSPAGQQSLAALSKAQVPEAGAGPALDSNLKAAVDAIENATPDPETKRLIAQVKDPVVEDALRGARDRAQNYEEVIKPVTRLIAQLEKLFLPATAARVPGAAGASIKRDFTVARLRFNALRYDAEARLNQAIANLYEVQVRRGNLSAERHHARSQRFFFGMLAAQMAVIVSTLALAARKRSLLWSVAAAAGVAAVCFALYVYLYV